RRWPRSRCCAACATGPAPVAEAGGRGGRAESPGAWPRWRSRMTSVHADPQLDPDDHDPRPAVRAVDGGAPDADGAVPPEADGVWSPARRRLTTALVLTITLVAFESLAIATVMPLVADDLGGLGLSRAEERRGGTAGGVTD